MSYAHLATEQILVIIIVYLTMQQSMLSANR